MFTIKIRGVLLDILPEISLYVYVNSRRMRAVRAEPGKDTFIPLHEKDLTKEHSNTILESHISLKYKRDGTIKGSTVAGSNKKKYFIYKEYVISPTFTTESALLTCMIDAEENRDVATVNTPNAFI